MYNCCRSPQTPKCNKSFLQNANLSFSSFNTEAISFILVHISLFRFLEEGVFCCCCRIVIVVDSLLIVSLCVFVCLSHSSSSRFIYSVIRCRCFPALGPRVVVVVAAAVVINARAGGSSFLSRCSNSSSSYITTTAAATLQQQQQQQQQQQHQHDNNSNNNNV